MKKLEVYNLIIGQNGIEHQMAVCIEELAELTKEITKLLRADAIGASTMHLAEEIGDVEICLEQLKMYYQLKSKVDYFKRFKLQRLEKFYIHITKEVKKVFEGFKDNPCFNDLCEDMVERGGGGTVTPLKMEPSMKLGKVEILFGNKKETGVKEKDSE